MDENAIKEVVTGALEKTLPEIVENVVTKKFETMEAKSQSDMQEIKDAVKEMTIASKRTDKGDELARKTLVVNIIKDVWHNNVSTPEGFNKVLEAHTKTMAESTATAGDELVFDQFETDVLRVIQTHALISNVKILPLTKGDKVNLPKATNGITTAYVAETGTPTASDAVTGFVAINIYKAVSLCNLTDELLDDSMTIPDVYNLIVEFIGESQAAFIENEILNGTGSSAIEGITVASGTNSVVLAATKRASDITDSDLVNVATKAETKFKKSTGNIAWIMSQYTWGKLMSIRTTDGMYLYPELRNIASPSLMGYKVILSEKIGVQASGTDIANGITIIFGDLTYFTMVRRKGLTLERGYYGNNWRDGINSLKATARFGGKCTFSDAFTILKNGTT